MPQPTATTSKQKEPEFYTVERVQQYLAEHGIGLSLFRIRDYCRLGKLKGVKQLNRWYIRPAEVRRVFHINEK